MISAWHLDGTKPVRLVTTNEVEHLTMNKYQQALELRLDESLEREKRLRAENKRLKKRLKSRVVNDLRLSVHSVQGKLRLRKMIKGP